MSLSVKALCNPSKDWQIVTPGDEEWWRLEPAVALEVGEQEGSDHTNRYLAKTLIAAISCHISCSLPLIQKQHRLTWEHF
jgi:hypothetical protein